MYKSLSITILVIIITVCPAVNNYSTVHAADEIIIEPTLDELLDRFASTKAIGVFTKLSIKVNVNRLYKSFNVYHDGKRPPTIEELRQRYDLMVQEMVMLVQNKDPELARDFYASRLLLWSHLSDPEKFKTI